MISIIKYKHMKSKWQPILKNNESWKFLNTSQETPWISKFSTLQIPQLIKTATLTVSGPVLTLPLTFSHETNRKKHRVLCMKFRWLTWLWNYHKKMQTFGFFVKLGGYKPKPICLNSNFRKQQQSMKAREVVGYR